MNKFVKAAEILNREYGAKETEESVRLFACMAEDKALEACTAESLAAEISEYSGLSRYPEVILDEVLRNPATFK